MEDWLKAVDAYREAKADFITAEARLIEKSARLDTAPPVKEILQNAALTTDTDSLMLLKILDTGNRKTASALDMLTAHGVSVIYRKDILTELTRVNSAKGFDRFIRKFDTMKAKGLQFLHPRRDTINSAMLLQEILTKAFQYKTKKDVFKYIMHTVGRSEYFTPHHMREQNYKYAKVLFVTRTFNLKITTAGAPTDIRRWLSRRGAQA